jgi:hypothetical protein
LVKERGATVFLEVEPELKALLSSLDAAVTVIGRGEPLPQFDYYSPLLSLPLAFKTTLTEIPRAARYLAPPEALVTAWRERLGGRQKPRIGVVWAGHPRRDQPGATRLDRQRSIALDRLAPLFAATSCEFYSLQKGPAVALLRGGPLRERIIDRTDELRDFADTAALIENLDLVISVDTAVAHVAGALGKPFWLLNRYNTCWRWLMDREDSPWYPSARIFRQPYWDEWGRVVEQVAAELRRL